MSRPPAKKLASFRGIGDEFRRVASAPRRLMNRDSASAHAFYGRNYLANGVPTSCAEINSRVFVALEHVSQGCNVGLGQVHYVCVVADRSAVRRGIIRAKNLEIRFLSESRLNGEWNEMSFRRMVLSQLTFRVGACSVEITQGSPAHPIRFSIPGEYAFDHPL